MREGLVPSGVFVCVCLCVYVCVHVRMCLRVSLAATCTCMLDSTYEGGACTIMCVCVCGSGNDCGYLISHQWEELNLLVMHVMVCTCTVGTSTDTYIMEKLPYTLTAAPLYPSRTGSEA